jgi:hypothetical protein
MRKKEKGLDSVFIESIQHRITRITRKQYSQINFDAQAYFYRIIASIAIQLSRKYGIHKNFLYLFKEILGKANIT